MENGKWLRLVGESIHTDIGQHGTMHVKHSSIKKIHTHHSIIFEQLELYIVGKNASCYLHL